MKLFTPVELPIFPFKLDHSSQIMTIGSCFSTNIGEELYKRGFTISVDPFGTLYNPFSIGKIVNYLSSDRQLPFEFEKYKGVYSHLDLPHTFSRKNKSDLIKELSKVYFETLEFFKISDTIIVTFGTSKVYSFEKHGIVASCHKIPQKYFNSKILAPNEIVTQWSDILKRNANKKFIFTVSPVRHAKDGMVVNQMSKSILILAIHQLCNENDNCFYFPSYEIQIDELRDYRFYKDDLLHPSKSAVEFIFEKFMQVSLSEESKIISKDFIKLVQLHEHRIVHQEEQKTFDLRKKEAINNLLKKYPALQFKWIQDKYNKN